MAKKKHLHLLGINGAGMAGIALHAANQGFEISGCDPGSLNPIVEQLGVKVDSQHDPSHVKDADLIGASTAIGDDHPELTAAVKKKTPVLRRDALLREVTDGKKVISVSGTHGKTSTSAMVAHILLNCGVDASFLVGGNAPTLGGGAGVGKSDWFVLEADESDASFLGPKTDVAVITNVEPDHLDFYGSYESLQAAFAKFASSARRAIICSDSIDATPLAENSNVISYGTTAGSDVSVQLHHEGAHVTGKDIDVQIELPVPGMHAILNATAAVLAAREAGVDPEKAVDALQSFANVDRRFTVRHQENEITIVDDYAHLPTEIKAVISAANSIPHDRLLIAFQPHRYSRTATIGYSFGDAFVGADQLIVTDIYPAGEQPLPGIDGKTIVDAVLNTNPSQQTAYIPNREDLTRFLVDRLIPGDLLLTLGAGDITQLSEEISEQWQKK